MSFPSTPEQLTSDWLSDKLGHPITNFEVEAFGEGAGIIGMVTRVHLTTQTGPATVIAKFPSAVAENRAVAATYNMYGREIQFYTEIAPTINLRVPDCYHTEFDAQDQSFVILMEDLQGWQIGDQVKGCSVQQTHSVIAGIATLHASTWQTDIDLISHNNPGQRDGMIAGFGVGWPVVQEKFADLIPDKAQQIGDKVANNVAQLLEQMTQPPICISHADLRLDNIFFRNDEIALVDWQSVCTSAPEQDLAYFVTQSLSTQVRNAEDWVAIYHQELSHNGVANYPLETCRRRYKISAVYLLCYAVIISGTLDLANERGMALGRTLFGNAMRALDELDAFDLLI